MSLGTSESVNKRDHSAIQYHAPYMQSQAHTAMLFPFPRNGHSSTFHTHNSALPTQQVLSSTQMQPKVRPFLINCLILSKKVYLIIYHFAYRHENTLLFSQGP